MAHKLFDPKKYAHNDRFNEKDMNKVLHLLSPRSRVGALQTSYDTVQWQLGLRSDREERVNARL